MGTRQEPRWPRAEGAHRLSPAARRHCGARVGPLSPNGHLVAVVVTAALALPANHAAAHAIVTEFSLQHAPVSAQAASEAVLQFNSSIEIGLSRVLLVSSGDVQRPLAIRAGKKPGELRVDLPALAAGAYALKCRIFATDGHLTEEVLRFRVGE